MIIPSQQSTDHQVALEARQIGTDTEVFFKITDFPVIEAGIYLFIFIFVFFVNSETLKTKKLVSGKEDEGGARIGVVWDASYSRHGKDIKRELGLLHTVLAERASGARFVDVYVLRNVLSGPTTFAVDKVDDVIKHISELKNDGGTNTSAITAPRTLAGQSKKDEGYRFFLLFTDGQGNLGEALPSNLTAPVFAFSDSAKANSNLLK